MKKAKTWGMSSHRYGAGQMKNVTLVVALAICLFNSMLGRAQSTTSAVTGTVTDATGAIVKCSADGFNHAFWNASGYM
jgi:hypothetical protein